MLLETPAAGTPMDDDHPQRSRLKLIALLLRPLPLAGGQARCTFVSGEDEEEEDDEDEGEDEEGSG